MTKYEFQEWSEKAKKDRVKAHQDKNKGSGLCRGLLLKEYKLERVNQKSTFSKGHKFSHTKLWRDHQVNPELIKQYI
jgi:hypothetical protein